MDDLQVEIMVMSGVEDGLVMTFATTSGDGACEADEWILTLGRRDDNDLCLRNDTFASRYHARLHHHADGWLLEDLNSKNGTYVEEHDEDARVSGTLTLASQQLFRVGRTWLRIQPEG